MDSVIVSVIVPVYNCEVYLQECIDSIRNQTHDRLEIILVDDGSVDSSGEICDKNKECDSRIIVVHQKNKGVSSARNAALNLATGKYICFVDADDWLELFAIERLLDYLKKNNADLCINKSFFKDVNNYISKLSTLTCGIYQNKEILKIHLSGEATSSSCMGIFDRQLINDIRFNEDIFMLEDWLFNAKVLLNDSRVLIIDEPLYHYRSNDGSASFSRLNEKKLTSLKIQRTLEEYIACHNIQYEYGFESISAFVINSLLVILAKSSIKNCRESMLQLKKFTRKKAYSIVKSKCVSMKVKVYVLLGAISPRLFCIAFRMKNAGSLVDYE